MYFFVVFESNGAYVVIFQSTGEKIRGDVSNNIVIRKT